jgi:membrane glycosyltransferase
MSHAALPPLPDAGRIELRRLGLRRALFAALVLATMAAATWAFAALLGRDGLDGFDMALVALFLISLPWYAIGLWNAAVGLAVLGLARDPVAAVVPAARRLANGPLRSRTAVVMPVHNETPERVFRHFEAVARSLEATGHGDAFELFLLSDTRQPEIALEEERLFAVWKRRAPHPERLHYRRRRENTRYKTGNLWDFLETHGGRFDYMLILDADSLMSGGAILRAVRIADANPEIGILQTLVVGLPSRSAFARIFQFGMRHGLRAYTAGAAWWQGDCGSFWGHNALVRIAPFMAHCRLPTLPGKPPFGGDILSHDQVEAVMMRRAGWQVRVVPEEDGSFEENPPALPEFLQRDLRWCQGNWQYLRLLRLPGLHLMGRVQLLLAILMYITGPAWVLASLVAVLAALTTGRLPVVSYPVMAPLPTGGGDALGWGFLAFMLVLPLAAKLAGVAQVLADRALRRANGGGLGVLRSFAVEHALSLILAPAMAVAETVMLLKMALGRKIAWDAQLRDAHGVPLRAALGLLWPQLLLGLLYLAAAVAAMPQAWPWAVIFALPLVAAAPVTTLTARADLGLWLARRGICAVPEEIAPPAIVVEAGHAFDIRRASTAPAPTSGSVATLPAPAAPPVD